MTGEAMEEQARLEGLREAGALLTRVLDLLQEECNEGTTASQLDTLAENMIVFNGAEPLFKGYNGFPGSICWGEEGILVHGIPLPSYTVQPGALIAIDCGVRLNGWCADACRLFLVPGPKVFDMDSIRRHLMLDAANAALEAGVGKCHPGNTLGDVGYAIETATNQLHHNVCKHYSGHFIGKEMHEDPSIPNFGVPGEGQALEVGDVVCIEPVISQPGVGYYVADDDWTVVTKNGNGCQIEAMVEVTEAGPEILAS